MPNLIRWTNTGIPRVLHPDRARELNELREAGLRSGELLTADRLAECYAIFRRCFRPDVLAGLDGVALLEAMHLHGNNKESLVYWLEFKNDEEFPRVFGSIGGGSALKFGIYRLTETGKWMAGSPQNPQELTIDQAIDRARQHRDELVAGAGVLERFSSVRSDEDYARLQQELIRTAPTVAELAWGHKC